MKKDSTLKITSLTVVVASAVALVVAAYFLVFESSGGWTSASDTLQLGSLLVASASLAAGFGLYHRRNTAHLQGQIVERKREVEELRRTKEVLRTNEAPYRGVVASLPVALFALDVEGMFTLLEGKGLDALGLDPDKAVGQSIFETYRDAPRIIEDVRLALAGETLSSVVEVNELTFEMRYSPLRVDGKFAGVLGVAADITRRKEAERALEESQRRLSALLSDAPVYLYRCRNEPAWPNEFVSDYALELTGYTPKELTDGTVMYGDLIVEEDRDRVWDEVQADLVERRRFELRYSIRCKDGEVRHVEERGQGVYGEDGNVEAIEGVTYDVTERVRTEEALSEAEELFRRSFEDAAIGMALVASDGRWLQVNEALCQIVGYAEEELLQKTFQEITHPDDLEADLGYARMLLSGEIQTYQMEKRYLHKNGHIVWILLSGSLVRDEAGEPLYFISQIQDITSRREAERALRKAEERYRTLVEQIPAVTYTDKVTDGPDEPIYTSPQIEELLGYTPEEWIEGQLWPKCLHPEDKERILAADERFESGGEPFSEEYRLLAKDGSVVWVREDAVLVKDEAGEPLYWQGVILDITERKDAEEELRKSRANLAEAQRIARLGSLEWDAKTRELYWSDETFRIYGFEPQSFVPTFERLLEIVHPEDRKMLNDALEGALLIGRPYDLEHRIVKPGGEVRVVHRRAEIVRGEDGEPIRMVGTVHDVTERKALEEQLQHQALHDPLTGLPNRTLFVDRLRQALARAKRRRSQIAVLFMDLDNFKVINDSLGHNAGDRLLVSASKRVKALLRPEDTIARLGGDEFIVLLEDTGTQDAVHVAERVLEKLRKPFVLGGRRLFITASIGIATGGATGSADGRYAADLLRNADMAMYRAKHSGKGRHAVFEEAMKTRVLKRLEMEHGLRWALQRGELKVHYQPQVLLAKGEYARSGESRAEASPGVAQETKITGIEALVRWEHPERGLLLPDEFIPLAEETGLIMPMGEAVLKEACRQTKELHERFVYVPPISIYVNLSARQFREPDLAQTVSRVLKETGLDPTCLHLEITESTVMSNAPATISTLKELTTLGVRLVIDDFGTGYSSLSYLARLPVDYIKIDRSFVDGLKWEPEAATLVSGVIDLAHALGLKAIAEGVESEVQLERVHSMGCDLAQGCYFSEPLPADEVSALLEESFT